MAVWFGQMSRSLLREGIIKYALSDLVAFNEAVCIMGGVSYTRMFPSHSLSLLDGRWCRGRGWLLGLRGCVGSSAPLHTLSLVSPL